MTIKALTPGLLTLILLFTASFSARSAIEAGFALDKSTEIGSGRLTYMFWDVYDATLYAADGKYDRDAPITLVLTYLRDLSGADIAQRSGKEMRRQDNVSDKQIKAWVKKMESIFPDVSDGDSLAGVMTQDGKAKFYLNEAPIGEIDDKAFTQAFFDIWLGDNTSEPELKAALTGESS